MTINEIAALAAVILSIGTIVALYIHLSQTMNTRFESISATMNTRFESITATMNTRFESVDRRLELIQGDLHHMDLRLSKSEG